MNSFRIILLISFLYLCYNTDSYSQEASFYGARNEALARGTVALNSSWALFYNPAGLIYDQINAVAGYQSKYISLGIDDGAFGFSFPIKNTAFGIGASYFGDNLLSKTKLVTGVAHHIGKTSLGIKTTYEQLRVDEIGSKAIFYFDIGGQIIINEQIIIGMVLSNLNQSKFDSLSLSVPTTAVQVGINYHPHNKLTLLAQVEKNIENPAIIRFGMEYNITQQVSIRTGLIPSPSSAYGGLGFNWVKIKLDLVGSYQQSLGWSGGLSIGIPLNEK